MSIKANDSHVSEYDDMGDDYVNYQRKFFASKEDWTRTKPYSELHKMKGKKVLDIGCGAGDDLAWCLKHGIDVYGIDPSHRMCELSKETSGKSDIVSVGGYEHIPFPGETFDLIFGRFSLHYLESFTDAYVEMARVMKKGAALLLVVSHPTYNVVYKMKSGEKVISVKLYGGKVTVKFPNHEMSEYLSETFFSLFDLKELSESNSVDAENPDKVPETLYIKAIKR